MERTIFNKNNVVVKVKSVEIEENEKVTYYVIQFNNNSFVYEPTEKWKNFVRQFHKQFNYYPKQLRNAVLGVLGSILYSIYHQYFKL